MSLYDQLIEALCSNDNITNSIIYKLNVDINKIHINEQNRIKFIKDIFEHKLNDLYEYNEIMTESCLDYFLNLHHTDKNLYKIYADTLYINIVEYIDNQYIVYHTHNLIDYKDYPFYLVEPYTGKIDEPKDYSVYFNTKNSALDSIIIDHISIDNKNQTDLVNNTTKNIDDFYDGETINKYNNQSTKMTKIEMIDRIMQKTDKYKISHLRAKLKSDIQLILSSLD